MSNKDPYEILGVGRSASTDEIKRAYRRLVKEHHPDHNPNDRKAEARFKEIQAAYEVLGDEKRRAEYDRFGAGGPAPEFHRWAGHAAAAGAGGGPRGGVRVDFDSFGDLNSIFEQFFQRPRGRNGHKRSAPTAADAIGENIEHAVDITFEEAARGARREVALHDPSGRLERIEVRIPPGIGDGQTIRVKGRGQPGISNRGDLLLRCRVLAHAYFRREGNDVLLDLPLTVPEAIAGTRVDIPTLDGPTMLTVPPGATSGMRLRLRGRGIPAARGGEPGDLHVIVKVTLPRVPSAKLRELVAGAADEFGPDPRADAGWAL